MSVPYVASPVQALDEWIRSRFVDLNTQLEDLYVTLVDRSAIATEGDEIKESLVTEGRELIKAILAENDIAQSGFGERFSLLGNVGYYMAACRRHEITEPSAERTSPLKEASTLALLLGASLNTAPRFVTSHMETHNPAIDGTYRTFTSRDAERVFLDYNTRSAFAYMRAADALNKISPLGVSHPVAADLLGDAERALGDALALNAELSERLDVDDFWFCVRPYYKPYRVGSREYRGANAGDFAAFNQIDLILGLCSPTDAAYTQVALEKTPYLLPEEQDKLRSAFTVPNLLDAFLECGSRSGQAWFQHNAAAYLRVCDAHGAAAAHHHNDLVAKFIEGPSASLPEANLQNITASGPPLAAMLTALENLRDQRLAADRHDIPTRHQDLAKLRGLLQ